MGERVGLSSPVSLPFTQISFYITTKKVTCAENFQTSTNTVLIVLAYFVRCDQHANYNLFSESIISFELIKVSVII